MVCNPNLKKKKQKKKRSFFLSNIWYIDIQHSKMKTNSLDWAVTWKDQNLQDTSNSQEAKASKAQQCLSTAYGVPNRSIQPQRIKTGWTLGLQACLEFNGLMTYNPL